MTECKFILAMRRIGELHDEINRRADEEAKKAVAAGGKPVPIDPEKMELLRQSEEILEKLLSKWC